MVKKNTPQARINRNNRKRGGKFEKTVADLLEMHVVPYSGSNSRFGWGDVRDVPGLNGGIWLGECKSMKVEDPDNPVYVIDHKWLSKNEERASEYGLMSFLAFTRFGKPHKFVMVEESVFNKMCELYGGTIPTSEYIITKPVWNTKNYHIPEREIVKLNTKHPSAVTVGFDNDNIRYYIIGIGNFKYLINETELHSKYKEGR